MNIMTNLKFSVPLHAPSLSKTSLWAAVLSTVPLLLISPCSTAALVENGDVLDVDASTPLDTYLVIGAGSTLNASNAATDSISIRDGGTLNFDGGTVQSLDDGVAVTNSTATINNVTVVAEGIGLLLNREIGLIGGSQVQVTGGSLQGGDAGALVTGLSRLQLNGTKVIGTGVGSAGLNVFGGDVFASNGTTITGVEQGVLMSSDSNRVGDNRLVLDNSSAEGNNGAAIRVEFGIDAQIEIRNGSSLIGGNGNILEVQGNSTANVLVSGSALQGDVQVGSGSVANLTFNQARMAGDIVVAEGGTGALSLQNRSTYTGNLTGVDSVSLDASSLTGSIVSTDNASTLSLQNSSVLTGSVTGVGNVNLNASAMTGDITSTTGAGDVSLLNGSQLTGNLVNTNSVSIADQSIWNMTATNTLNALAMSGGVVKFGAANEFFQLNVGSLSGKGLFIMDVDYATNQHDTLIVSGSATGSHTLAIAGSGVDPVSPEQLTMVRTGGGDATFTLMGSRAVDVGTYSYDLGSRANGGGTDWFLDPTTRTISPGTASVLALFNTAPTVWYGELTSLRSRMGELRFNGGKAGGWIRSYGNKYVVDEASGVGYKQTQQGFSLGADAPLPVGDGQWLVGVLAGHSTSDLDLSRGTSGTVKSYYAGVYTTWLDQDSGYYFDGVLKFNRFRNDSKVSMSDGTRAKGDYDNSAAGGSVEFGRHIKLDDGYFIEPFTQLSAVVIQGKNYGLDNGMQAEGDRTRSLLGKAGVTAGRNFVLNNGNVVQPYVRAAGVHEFAKNNEVQVNNNTFNNDLSGSRAELGAGVAVAFSDSLQVHADFDYANGKHIEQPFGANVGLRYSW